MVVTVVKIFLNGQIIIVFTCSKSYVLSTVFITALLIFSSVFRLLRKIVIHSLFMLKLYNQPND